MRTRARSRVTRARALTLGAVFSSAVVLVGWCASSGAAPARTSTSPPVHLVYTTPAAKGSLSSMTWDLPAGEPTTLDYVKSGDYSTDILVSNMCDYLVRLTPTWKYKPGLATSWKYANSTTLVLTIRQGVHFWNGQELTSADVAYSMLRNMTAKNTPVNGQYYKFVKSITATGPFQVTVHFTKPDELFIKEMGTVAGAVAEKSYVESKGTSYGTASGGVMCSGPYELAKWNPGTSIVLKANPHYWTRSYTPKIQTITVKFIENTSTLTSELISGELTGAYGFPATSYPELKNASDGNLYFGPSLAFFSLFPIGTSGPMADPTLREALSLAINRTAIASVVFYGGASPSKTFLPKTVWATAQSVYKSAYAKLPSDSQNLAEARKLVDSVPDHSRTITLALLAGDQTEVEIATAVQQEAKQVGLNIKLDEMQALDFDDAFYLPQYRKGLNLIEAFGYLDVPDPLDYLALFIPKGGEFNYTNYTNRAVNLDVTKAYSVFTNTARARLITAAQTIYTKDLMVIPMFNLDNGLFLNKRITGAPVSFAYIYEPCFAKLGAAK